MFSIENFIFNIRKALIEHILGISYKDFLIFSNRGFVSKSNSSKRNFLTKNLVDSFYKDNNKLSLEEKKLFLKNDLISKIFYPEEKTINYLNSFNFNDIEIIKLSIFNNISNDIISNESKDFDLWSLKGSSSWFTYLINSGIKIKDIKKINGGSLESIEDVIALRIINLYDPIVIESMIIHRSNFVRSQAFKKIGYLKCLDFILENEKSKIFKEALNIMPYGYKVPESLLKRRFSANNAKILAEKISSCQLNKLSSLNVVKKNPNILKIIDRRISK
jgi:hypothetical protein